MAVTVKKERPLSPHLQIYRPQITSLLSICHRLTGLSLLFYAPLFSFFLALLVFFPMHGDAVFDFFLALAASSFGAVFLFLFLLAFFFSLFFHLFNGVRHLVWDLGFGFHLTTVALSAWLVMLATAFASVLSMRFVLLAYLSYSG